MQPFVSLALLCTVILPPSVYIILKTSSMSAGVLAVAVLHSLIAFLAIGYWKARRTAPLVLICLAALALIVSMSLNAAISDRHFDAERFWISLLLFFIVAIGAASFVRAAMEVSDEVANRAVKTVFYVLLVTAIASALGYPIFEVDDGKPVSFFIEPSHFALNFLPFLLYTMVRASTKMKVFFMGSVLVIAIGVPNLTLIVGLALVAFLTLPKRYIVLLAGVATGAIFTTDLTMEYADYLAYYVARLEFSTDNQNLSVLAFLQGWERAYLNLVETNGIGVGFQQFGIVGSRGDIQGAILASHGDFSNLLDGGSVGAKLVGEFGVVGVLLLIAYLVAFVRHVKWFRSASFGNSIDLFFRCCFTVYAMNLFMRSGGGYFSPIGFLMLASLFWLAVQRRERVSANNNLHFVRP